MSEEMKLELPISKKLPQSLNDCHLLFIFHHVHVQLPKKKEKAKNAEVLLAYAPLIIYENDKYDF